MAANPTIRKLGQELIALNMTEGVTCEDDSQKCRRTPEYRCELGPIYGGPGSEWAFQSFTKDLCPVHARKFATSFYLQLPTRYLEIVRAPAEGHSTVTSR